MDLIIDVISSCIGKKYLDREIIWLAGLDPDGTLSRPAVIASYVERCLDSVKVDLEFVRFHVAPYSVFEVVPEMGFGGILIFCPSCSFFQIVKIAQGVKI